jgi:type I restriction enzyme S subunit
MSNLKEVKISDLAEKIASGGTPSTKTTSYYDGGIPWLNTKEINFNRITQTERTISNEGLTNSSAKWIKENSVIVAMYGATAAKVAINKIPLTTNQACCNITLNPSLADYNYIYYRFLIVIMSWRI